MAGFSLKQAIETAIKAEELGIKFYSGLALKFSSNEELKNVFELLAKDEVEHKKQFQSLLGETSPNMTDITGDQELFLKGCDISKYFPSMEEVNPNMSAKEVLKNAFEFEKDSVLYYSGLKDLLPMSDKLDIIIAKEKGHMTKIMDYMINESKFRGIEDAW